MIQKHDCRMETKLLIVSGFSGSGKGTVLENVLNNNADLELVRSYTTRPRRNDKDCYRFVTREEFVKHWANYDFLETNYYAGEWYGTPRRDVERIISTGRIAVLEIDPHGYDSILLHGEFRRSEIRSLFVVADADTVFSRLQHRKSESRREIIRRMKRSIEESKCICHYDAVIINNNLAESVNEMERLIYSEEIPKTVFNDVLYRKRMREILQDIMG